VWKYINRERKKKESVSEEITIQEWEEYFMKLLEGRKEEGEAGTNEGEADGAGGNRNHSGRGEKTDKELEKKQGTVRNGVQNEAWMYGPKEW
jgi:hypothetical protein